MAGQWESLAQPQNAVDNGGGIYYPWSWVSAGKDRPPEYVMAWAIGSSLAAAAVKQFATGWRGRSLPHAGRSLSGRSVRQDHAAGAELFRARDRSRSLKRRTGAEPYSNPS
jgi:hypothetical protein